MNDGLRERAGPARRRLLHEPAHAAHERRVRELTGHQRQRAPRHQHARDLTRGQLRVQEVERVGDHHQIEAGRLEGQLFSGGVERAQRDPARRRRRAQLIQHRLRGLDRRDVEATRGEREREMSDAGAEIANAATDRPRQLRQRVDQRHRVRRPGGVELRHAVEDPPRRLIETDLAPAETHRGDGISDF